MARVGVTAAQIAKDTLAQVLGTKVPFARPCPARTCPPARSPSCDAGSGDSRRPPPDPAHRGRRPRGGPRVEIQRRPHWVVPAATWATTTTATGSSSPRDRSSRGPASATGRTPTRSASFPHRVLGRRVYEDPPRLTSVLRGPVLPFGLAPAGPRAMGGELHRHGPGRDRFPAPPGLPRRRRRVCRALRTDGLPAWSLPRTSRAKAASFRLVGSGQAPFDGTVTGWFAPGRAAPPSNTPLKETTTCQLSAITAATKTAP